MKIPNLALDVDMVLANFVEGLIDKAYQIGLGEAFPTSWRECRSWYMSERFHEVMDMVKADEQFWLGLNPMPFTTREIQPEIYLTSRPIQSDVTERWLTKHGFPSATVITVDKPEKKVPLLKEKGLWLVDDYHVTVNACLEAGVKAYLFQIPYQRGYDVRHLPTVRSLEEAVEKAEGKNTTLAWRN